jgi:hypothetical protein
MAVVVVGAQDLQWVDLSLAWDPALAEVTDAASGSLLTLDGAPVSVTRTLESGRAHVRFARPTGASGSGAVASFTFRGVAPGSGTLAVESITIGRGGATESPAPPPPARIVVAP